MQLSQRTSALILIACLVAPGFAQTSSAPLEQSSSQEDMQPKFIWGLVLNIAFKFAMQAFSSWLTNKLTTDMNASNTQRLMMASANAVIVTLSDASLFGAKSVGAEVNTKAGEPTNPLRVENGKENYQGVHVALVAFDGAYTATGLKPITAGFKTGERLKLKVLPTFDGLLVIENVNPKNERNQIYPAQQSTAVAVKAGVEILIPLAKDEFFEFAGASGDEQLVVTLRDPRAFGEAASKAEVNRKDEKTGSSFVQEVGPGTYPVIAQSLKLSHSAN
jgi:hypothetical protein